MGVTRTPLTIIHRLVSVDDATFALGNSLLQTALVAAAVRESHITLLVNKYFHHRTFLVIHAHHTTQLALFVLFVWDTRVLLLTSKG